jgi:hypothetical protein
MSKPVGNGWDALIEAFNSGTEARDGFTRDEMDLLVSQLQEVRQTVDQIILYLFRKRNEP